MGILAWCLLISREVCLASLLIPGDVVIHIFLPQQRAFYNLEEFYANATQIELPFENQPPPFRG